MLIENPLSTSPSLFPILECFHIAGFALSIGMTALVDFRLLGFGLQKPTPAEIARSFDWWMLCGLIIALFSGLLIFSTDPDMYYLNWSFLIKMACLVLAISFNYTIHRRAVSGSLSPPGRSARRLCFTGALGLGHLWRYFHRRHSPWSLLTSMLISFFIWLQNLEPFSTFAVRRTFIRLCWRSISPRFLCLAL